LKKPLWGEKSGGPLKGIIGEGLEGSFGAPKGGGVEKGRYI